MFVAVCGDKGAPGVTTAALALASAWPLPATVVEASPAGGDLAIRLHPKGAALPETPTVLSVVTASRSATDQDPVGTHAHVLNSTTTVVPGAALAEQMSNVGDWSPLADALGRTQTRTLADVGHLHAASPVLTIAARAEVVVVVSRPDRSSVVRLRERLCRLATDLAHLRGGAPRLFPLLISTTRHGEADVSDLRAILIETTVNPFVVDVGFLAHDPGAVRRLEAGEEPAGRLSRTDLLRTARDVATQLEHVLGSLTSTGVASVRGGGS
jgi:hypothetical protein